MEPLSARDLLLTLWRRRWAVALVAGCAVAAGLLAAAATVPVYVVRGKLLLKDPESARAGSLDFDRNRHAKNQREILTSRAFLDQAITRAGIDPTTPLVHAGPFSRAVQTLAIDLGCRADRATVQDRYLRDLADGGGLGVDVVQGSDVLAVSVRTDDPSSGRVVVDAILGEFVRWTDGRRRTELTRERDWIAEELEGARIDLLTADTALRRFREENAIGGPEDDVRMRREEGLIEALTNRLVDARLSRERLLGAGLTGQHPEVLAADEHVAAVARELGEATRMPGRQPGVEMELERLDRIARVRKAAVDHLAGVLSEVERTLSSVDDSAIVVEPAMAGRAPIRPRPLLNLVVALAAGLLLGGGLALLLDRLDGRIGREEEASRLLGAPVIGQVYRRELRNYYQERDRLPEAYRNLRAALVARADGGGDGSLARTARTIAVVGADRNEDATAMVAKNLALGFSLLEDERVLFIDADLRHPSVHLVIDRDESYGLVDYLIGAIDRPREKATVYPNLMVITGGQVPSNPMELVASRRLAALIEDVAGRYDRVVVNTSTLARFLDPAILASRVDATVVAVSGGRTRVVDARRARARLEENRARVVGVVYAFADQGGGP